MAQLLSPATLLGLAALWALGSWHLRRRPAWRRRALVRFADRADLPLPDAALWARTEAAVTDRNVAVDTGAQVGIAAAALVALTFGVPTGITDGSNPASGLWALVVAGAALVGAAIAAAWSGTRQVRRGAPRPGPRLARPTAASVSDYVAPLERWSARTMAASPAAALLAGLAISLQFDTVGPGELVHRWTLLAVLVGPLALLAAEVTARRLLDLPQPAGSPLELAWSDALRARVLRDVVTAPLAIGIFAMFALLITASAGVSDPVVANGLHGLVGLGVVGMAVVATVGARWQPQRHFRQRLWPDPATASASERRPEPNGGGR